MQQELAQTTALHHKTFWTAFSQDVRQQCFCSPDSKSDHVETGSVDWR
jgi:hypothetical protein